MLTSELWTCFQRGTDSIRRRSAVLVKERLVEVRFANCEQQEENEMGRKNEGEKKRRWVGQIQFACVTGLRKSKHFAVLNLIMCCRRGFGNSIP